MERQDSVQSLIQKLVLGNNGQELHKSKDQDFLVLPNLAWLFLTLRQMFRKDNTMEIINFETKNEFIFKKTAVMA